MHRTPPPDITTAAQPVTLHYASQEKPPRAWGATVAVIVIAFFVCAASVAIFGLVVERGRDPWPAAVGVASLAGMGVACAFFLSCR